MVSRICLPSTRWSVTTMTVSEVDLPPVSRPINWWPSQAVELLLPEPAELD